MITSCQTGGKDRASREGLSIRFVAKGIEHRANGADRARTTHETGSQVVNVNIDM